MPAAYPIEPGQTLKPKYPEAWPQREPAPGGLLKHRVLRFGAAGGFITCVDLALVWLLSHLLPPTLAVAVAYLLAMAVHFCLNKFWVFENRDLRYVRQMWKYGLVVLACWSCTVAVFSVAMQALTSHILLAKLIAIPPTTLLGYVLMKKFVFAEARPASETAKQ